MLSLSPLISGIRLVRHDTADAEIIRPPIHGTRQLSTVLSPPPPTLSLTLSLPYNLHSWFISSQSCAERFGQTRNISL